MVEKAVPMVPLEGMPGSVGLALVPIELKSDPDGIG